MSNPTSNFGWQMPTNSDLVTDLPADFEVFGQGVDTTLADLKGGTTGQMLTKTSNTDMDFSWVTPQIGDITAITATSPLTGGGTSGDVTVGIQAASTSQSGAVQLTDSTSSTSTTTAATPNSVKTSYDLANAAIPKSLVDAKGDIVSATADNTPSRVAVGNNGEQLLADSTNTSGLRWTATPSASNPVLNSAMNVWQRGTSFTTAGGLAYTADRWISRTAGVGGSMVTTRDTSAPTGFQYSAKVRRSTSNTDTNSLQFTQCFETVNSLLFAGKTVTLSFYAKAGANFSSASNSLGSNIIYGTGTDQPYYSYTGMVDNVQGNTLTTSWQRFTQTLSIPSTATEISVGFYWVPVGTAGADDSFYVTGVQLDIGNVALPYRAYGATYQAELAACQRYYFRTNASDAYSNMANSGYTGSTTAFNAFVQHPTTMRTKPSSIDWSGLHCLDVASATITLSNASFAAANTNNTNIAFTASGATASRFAWLRDSGAGTGYLGLSAEL